MSPLLNPLRRVWAEGRVALNGWIAAPSIITTEAMAVAGWDTLTSIFSTAPSTTRPC